MPDKFWSQINYQTPADLREEFDKLIDGHVSFDGIGQFLLVRNLSTTFCVCYDQVEGSAVNCKFCQGEGYTWNEGYIRGYFTQTFGRSLSGAASTHSLEAPGYFDKDKALIYVKAGDTVKTGDAIYRIALNNDGSIYYSENSGIERTEKWRVVNVEDKRYDLSRLAYNICTCEREEA